MTRSMIVLCVFALLLVAGCKTTATKNLGHEGGEAYADVPVPAEYEEYDTPPFKRQDGASGKRLYGRYAYKSTNGVDTPSEVLSWFKTELSSEGWTLKTEESNDDEGTFKALFEKDEDQLQLSLEPDNRVQSNKRFSVLTVEMNPQYD